MSGLSSLNKESSWKSDIGTIVAGAVALKAITGTSDYFQSKQEERKFGKVIEFAKGKHPELGKVPQKKMMDWMDAFHTLAPKMAVNNELGSSMLLTAHDYGGNIDMATAKLIAETGSKSGSQGHREEVLGFISGGKSFMDKRKD